MIDRSPEGGNGVLQKGALIISRPKQGDAAARHLRVIAIETPSEARARELLENEGVLFHERQRTVLLPPIIHTLDGKTIVVNAQQVKKLVPLREPAVSPASDQSQQEDVPEKPYDKRCLMVEDSIAEMSSFLFRRVMTDSYPNHSLRSLWKKTLERKYQEEDFLAIKSALEQNQLRASPLSVGLGWMQTMTKYIGSREIAKLRGIDEDVQQQFRDWNAALLLAIKGDKKGRQDLPDRWETDEYSIEQKIEIVRDVNNIILNVLEILSAGLENQPRQQVDIT